MFTKRMTKNLRDMIYQNRKVWKPSGCPFDQCCRVCAKIFPEWDEWVTRNGLDPTERGNHPCDYYTPEQVKAKIKEVILDE